MKYLKFKNSQLEASNIIMGCMRLNSLSVKEAQRHIETAVEAGINMFDHADIYGGGECEELFARAVDMRGSFRDKIILQSKCSIRNGYYDFSKEYILESVDGILKRLNKIEYRINDRVYLGKNLYININMIDNILFKLKDLINYKIEIENNHNFYELNLQLAFLHLNNENMSYAYNNKLKNKIKDLLLSNSTIEKSFEMGDLKFNIKVIYTKEYINFYKGKRKIIFN